MEEILERQLLFRGRAVTTFSTVEKTLTGCMKSFHRPHASCEPYVVQACLKPTATHQQLVFDRKPSPTWQIL